MKNEIMRMERITYVDKGVTKLEDFNLQVYEGEILGFIPVNSHGLEELLSLFQTNMPLRNGYVYYGGEMVNSWRGPLRSQNRICVIRARSCLVEGMTVAENIFVLRQGFRQEIIPSDMLRKQLAPFLKDIGVEIQADTYVEKLSNFERVVVEILRAVVIGQRLIILEEISTLIGESKLRKLYEIIRYYASQGFSFIYINLHFEELQQICDRVVLFTNGRIQKVISKSEMHKGVLDKYTEQYRYVVMHHTDEKKEEKKKEEEIFRLDNIIYGSMEKPLDLAVCKGECVVLQCVDSMSYKNIKSVLMGDIPLAGGTIWVKHKKGKVLYKDIAVVQEDLTTNMLFPELSYFDNLCLGLANRVPGVCHSRKIKASIKQEYKEYIKEELYLKHIDELTEKQKYQLVYMRILLQKPKVVFCFQPFKGADLVHRMYIWEQLEILLRHGIAVIIVSVNLADSLTIAQRLFRISEKGAEEIAKDDIDSMKNLKKAGDM